LLTPEVRSRLLGLFGERFFLWIVVVRVGIDRPSIYEWGREQEPSVKNDSKIRNKEESKEGRGRDKETGYRTALFPELVIGLSEEHFFLWIVTRKEINTVLK